MSQTQIALLATHLVFTGACLLGFAMPLALAGAEAREARGRRMKEASPWWDVLSPLLDIWLLLEDSVPVFWIFRAFRDMPEDMRAARGKWDEEPSLRWLCYCFLLLAATLPVYLLF